MGDDLSTASLVSILLFLLFLSAFFSGTETALMRLNRYKLKNQVRRGNKSARILEQLPINNYILAIRPSHVSLVPISDDDLEISMRVNIAEISGSETLIHTVGSNINLLMNLSGVHDYSPDTKIKIYIPSHKLFVFNAAGALVKAPGANL